MDKYEAANDRISDAIGLLRHPNASLPAFSDAEIAYVQSFRPKTVLMSTGASLVKSAPWKF